MEARTLILMGRTGNGKSSTGNSIIGRNVFKVGFSYTSATKQCQLEQTTWKDGRKINVIDTPGFFDTNCTNTKEYLQNEVAKCIDFAKDGVHGVLYVLSVKNRFTAEEAGVLKSLQLLFGTEIVNYVVIVFTGGDDLESDGLTLEAYLKDCQPELEEVIRLCNMRTVLFNNKTTSQTKKEGQRNELMKQVENIISKNGGKPYCNELLRQAKENQQKLLCRQTHCAVPGNTSSEEEMIRINAEHIKQLNALQFIGISRLHRWKDCSGAQSDEQIRLNETKSFYKKDEVEEPMQRKIKGLEERILIEQQKTKEIQEIAVEAIEYSEEVAAKSRKSCPLNNNNSVKWLCEKFCQPIAQFLNMK